MSAHGSRWPLALWTLVLAGCTLDDGAWFAQVQPRLQARYLVPPDRDIDGRFQRLASGYEVALDRAELQISQLDLIAAAATTGSAFDPAHPPPGYSLCHNGHCHADDGRLVPYADIEAQLAGAVGDGGAAPVLSLGGASFDLLAPQPVPLACPGGCRLDRTRIARAEATIASLRLEGRARSGPGAPHTLAERPFTVDLPVAGGPVGRMAGPLDLPADNRHPPRVELLVTIDLGPTLFDRLDLAGFPDEAGRRLLAEAVTHGALSAELQR